MFFFFAFYVLYDHIIRVLVTTEVWLFIEDYGGPELFSKAIWNFGTQEICCHEMSWCWNSCGIFDDISRVEEPAFEG